MITEAVVLALYASMIIIVGIVGMRKTKSSADFLIGGGVIGPWMTAFSYGTAYFSAVIFIGFAGRIGWDFGFSALWIAVFNAVIGVNIAWRVIGWKIRQASVTYGISTMSEFLEKRYRSRNFKLLSAVVIFIFLVPYSAAVFMGLSYLVEASLGVPYIWVLCGMGVFSAAYIMMGGYKSIALIDLIFGIMMISIVLLMYFLTVHKGGGIASISSSLQIIHPKLVQPVGPPGFWPLFTLVFLTSVAPLGMPQLVQKFYAVRDKQTVKIGATVCTLFALILGGVAYFMGSTTRVFLGPSDSPHVFAAGIPDYDRLMPQLLMDIMPTSLSVVVLLLILSASMSTLASLVLISSSSFTKDFWVGFINKGMSDKSITLMMRVLSGVFILMAVLFAALEVDVIVEILGISWGALGSFFLGPFLWGLFSEKFTRLGAYFSGLGGLATCLILYFWGLPSPEAGTIGMIVSLMLNPLVSGVQLAIVKRPSPDQAAL